MASSVIASFPRGPRPHMRVELSGSQSFYERPTRFAIDWIDKRGDLVLHFNARPDEDAVVLTSFVEGSWGESTVVRPYPFSVAPDVPFRLAFEVLEDKFCVFVDGRHLADFPHRGPPSTIRKLCSSTFVWRLQPDGRALAPSGETHTFGWEERPVVAEPNPRRPKPLPSFRLFAVVCTWMEEDVISATVANCLRQGCERVYLVDNASPDRTVERAVAAGAILSRTFASERFLETDKIAQMQAVVDEVSEQEGDEHIWWLWADADEFHHGPHGLTLHEYLRRLDRRFRIVGTRFFHHTPSAVPAYAPDRHPLDFQPLCYEVSMPNCALGHSKHSLQRWDRGGPPILSGGGFHTAQSETVLREPTVGTFLHHFPYRSESTTRRRLETLFGKSTGSDRIGSNPDHYSVRARLSSLEAIYEQRWADVAHFPPCTLGFVPERRPWEAWVGRADRFVARWY